MDNITQGGSSFRGEICQWSEKMFLGKIIL